MRINTIITRRQITNYTSGQIVYEWEDVFADLLGAKLCFDNDRRRSRLCKFIPFFRRRFVSSRPTFVFDMSWRDHEGLNARNIIPTIIDFYSRDECELQPFYKAFKKNPVVLISSCEVCDFLKTQNCPLHIAHLGLSISDSYRITEGTSFEKKYDLVMMGRQNVVLKEFALRYADAHPDFSYIYQEIRNNDATIIDRNGEVLGTMNNRNEYMKYLSLGRTVLYSTPDIDTDGKRSHGFNQVTPRLLESIASGCHVIARYPMNSDVEFYELDKIVLANINTYEEFESSMDYARSNDVDMSKYAEYLQKHYTSVRVQELKTIIETI